MKKILNLLKNKQVENNLKLITYRKLCATLCSLFAVIKLLHFKHVFFIRRLIKRSQTKSSMKLPFTSKATKLPPSNSSTQAHHGSLCRSRDTTTPTWRAHLAALRSPNKQKRSTQLQVYLWSLDVILLKSLVIWSWFEKESTWTLNITPNLLLSSSAYCCRHQFAVVGINLLLSLSFGCFKELVTED